MTIEDRKIFEQRKESIRNMIYDEEYIPLKFKEMAYLMNVPHKEKDKLREVLDALVAEGSVELTARGKYVKADQESLVGVFTAHPRGFGFVTVEGEPEDIFIPAPYTGGAFHKDVVKVKISRESHGEGKRREGVVGKGSGERDQDPGRHLYEEQIFWICPSGRYPLRAGCVHFQKRL